MIASSGDRNVTARYSNALYGLGIDEIIGRGVNEVAHWPLPDRNGNTAYITGPMASNGVATIRESYRYDAFGMPTIYNAANPPQVISSSAIANRFLFTGREYNSQFGFYEYRARAYHPGLGRFMSEDPKGFDAGDYNFYRYCGNDPWDRTDPMGLADQKQQTYNATLELQRLKSVIGSHIKQWTTVATLPITFTKNGNYANPDARSHVVPAGAIGTLKGRTDASWSTSRDSKGVNANLRVDYWIKAVRYDFLERQHSYGGGEWSNVRGLVEEKGNFFSQMKAQWQGGIPNWEMRGRFNGYFKPEARLQRSLDYELQKFQAIQHRV